MDIKKDFELGKHFTFQNAKEHPIHNWFYYKEGFSPDLVDRLIEYSKNEFDYIYDPFCGVGTTLLRSKELNIKSYGGDISPLAVFITKVKTENYSKQDLEIAEKTLKKILEEEGEEYYNLKLELFNPSIIFPKNNINFIKKMRAKIEKIEDSKIKNLFLLALLSIIPQTSYIVKDGGVLRINKRKRTLPAKKLFLRKVKRMLNDLRKTREGNVPEVAIRDAKEKKPYRERTLVITSPPYVNAVDYTKVYGMELSLLGVDSKEIKKLRNKMISSSIYKKGSSTESFIKYSFLPIVQHYLNDMKEVIKKISEGEAEVFLVVSNALIHNNHIEIDNELSLIMDDIGYKSEIIIGKIRKTRINNVIRNVRESAVHGWL